MSADPPKRALSGKLLSMKFMQRQQEQEQRQKFEQEQQKVISESQWVIEYDDAEFEKPKIQVEYEPSYMAFEHQTIFGRRSFGKFNPAIEKISYMVTSDQRITREEAQERHDTITDDDMAARYANMAGISGQGSGRGMRTPVPAQPAKKRKASNEESGRTAEGEESSASKQSRIQLDADRWQFKKPE